MAASDGGVVTLVTLIVLGGRVLYEYVRGRRLS